MKLRMVSIDSEGRVRIAADGPITADTLASHHENPLRELLGDGWPTHKIFLDLSRADSIDTSAVGWLLTCHKELAAHGGMMVLHSAQPKVMRILKTLKIEAILPMFDNAEIALRNAMAGRAQ